MRTYFVELRYICTSEFFIEADSPNEAYEEAQEQASAAEFNDMRDDGYHIEGYDHQGRARIWDDTDNPLPEVEDDEGEE